MKSFTDLEQSKKLVKILPLESADMWWAWYSSPFDDGHYDDFPMFCKPICNPDESVPCWSLSALLGVLPKSLIYTPNPALDGYSCKNIMHDLETYEDNPIDACYEMIIKLHELNLL